MFSNGSIKARGVKGRAYATNGQRDCNYPISQQEMIIALWQIYILTFCIF